MRCAMAREGCAFVDLTFIDNIAVKSRPALFLVDGDADKFHAEGFWKVVSELPDIIANPSEFLFCFSIIMQEGLGKAIVAVTADIEIYRAAIQIPGAIAFNRSDDLCELWKINQKSLKHDRILSSSTVGVIQSLIIEDMNAMKVCA